MTHKTPLVAHLTDEEVQIVRSAQEKYIIDGNGNASIRTLLLIGCKAVLDKKVV